MEITHCKNCTWFKPISSMPAAVSLHENLQKILGKILPQRDGSCGVCRKVTFCEDRPVFTNENGFCHRAEKKED